MENATFTQERLDEMMMVASNLIKTLSLNPALSMTQKTQSHEISQNGFPLHITLLDFNLQFNGINASSSRLVYHRTKVYCIFLF